MSETPLDLAAIRARAGTENDALLAELGYPGANASQRGGERLPSDPATAPTQVDPDADTRVTASAFPEMERES